MSWENDKLNREAEAETLLRFLDNRMATLSVRGEQQSYVLNLDAPWGYGKSFFLDGTAAVLKAEGHAVARVNAWETDFASEPLLAILSALDKALQPYLTKPALKAAWGNALSAGSTIAVSLVKNVASQTAKRYAGDFVEEAREALGGPVNKSDDEEDSYGVGAGIEEAIEKLADRGLEKLLIAFRAQEASITTFRTQVGRLISSLGGKRIYVLVDELDRCRPDYAVRTLEAVKHLFNTPGVVFIIATDTSQLIEAIKAVYGQSFGSGAYLRRFFNRSYRLRPPPFIPFVEHLFDRYGIEPDDFDLLPEVPAVRYIAKSSEAFSLSLRDLEQAFDLLGTVKDTWPYPIKLQLAFLWPLICMFHRGDRSAFDAVAAGSSIDLPKNLLARQLLVGKSWGRHSTSDFSIDVQTLFGSAAEFMRTDIVDFLQNSPTNTVEQHLSDSFRREVGALHDGQLLWSPRTISVIREYPNYVELAFRFSAKD